MFIAPKTLEKLNKIDKLRAHISHLVEELECLLGMRETTSSVDESQLSSSYSDNKPFDFRYDTRGDIEKSQNSFKTKTQAILFCLKPGKDMTVKEVVRVVREEYGFENCVASDVYMQRTRLKRMSEDLDKPLNNDEEKEESLVEQEDEKQSPALYNTIDEDQYNEIKRMQETGLRSISVMNDTSIRLSIVNKVFGAPTWQNFCFEHKTSVAPQ